MIRLLAVKTTKCRLNVSHIRHARNEAEALAMATSQPMVVKPSPVACSADITPGRRACAELHDERRVEELGEAARSHACSCVITRR